MTDENVNLPNFFLIGTNLPNLSNDERFGKAYQTRRDDGQVGRERFGIFDYLFDLFPYYVSVYLFWFWPVGLGFLETIYLLLQGF